MTYSKTFVQLTCAALLALGATTARAQTPWTFVSSPDLFNSDIADLSGGTDAAVAALYDGSYASNLVQAAGWPGASGGKNGVTANMASTYNQLIGEMVTNAGGNPQAFVAAGDLINGRWFNNNTTNMFDPGGTTFGKLNNAADVYFSWYRELFRQNGIDTVIGALGDHDIGDNDWGVGSNKANHVDTMKVAFGRNMVDPLNLPATWNGVSSTAPQNGVSEYDEGSFIKQVNNTLFVTVDIFEYSGAGTNQHYRYGAVDADVSGTVGDANTHLGWLDAVLAAADADPTVDHVIVQGHAPALPGVRKQSSSGMMMRDRDDGDFWQTLQAHSHDNGGKVRMYFAGEVHTATASKDAASDIVQVVHGNPPIGNGSGNYVVYTVDEDTITAELYQYDLQSAGSSYWQPSKVNSTGPDSMTAGVLTGTLTIDVSGAESTYQATGWLNLVNPRGVLLNYGFDVAGPNGSHSNTGDLGDLYYNANENGNPTTTAGKFGNAISLDNDGDFLKTAGGLAPVTEGRQRSVTGWFKSGWTSSTGAEWDTILGYGQDNINNGEFNVRFANGTIHLHVDNSTLAFANVGALDLYDSDWHHFAVVLPEANDNMLSDVKIYIDGVEYSTTLQNGTDVPIRTYAGSQSNIHIGASAEDLRAPGNRFNGDLDDISMWGSALTGDEVKGLFDVADSASLAYDTRKFEQLRDVHDGVALATVVDGLHWYRQTGLTGAAGLAGSGNQFSVVLDAAGDTGVVSVLQGDVEMDDDVDTADIDALFANLGSASGLYDVALDGGPADNADVDALVHDVLGTEYGDANNDQMVSLFDLNIIGANFGKPGTWATGDFNGDGQVTLFDLNILGANFGFDGTGGGGGGGPFSPAVPEPASLVLIGLAALALRKRQK